MSHSGVQVASECVDTYNTLKLGKTIRYIIFKLSEDSKSIVVERKSDNNDWEEFRDNLVKARSKGGKGPRYAVYDFPYDSDDGARNKIIFIAWSPDDANIKAKMVYASSKDALRRAFVGIGDELQANEEDDIEYDHILDKVSKGKGKKPTNDSNHSRAD